LSAEIAVIYCGAGVREVAEAFADGARPLSGEVRLLRVAGTEASGDDHPVATIEDIEWADGIGFGTPARGDCPTPELMDLIERGARLSRDAPVGDKVVSVFTDEPEQVAQDLVGRPLWDALYQWGAVIVGPRASELTFGARSRSGDPATVSGLPAPRARSAGYRGRRLAVIAGALKEERARRGQVGL
jgi:NAD(P)H dehydrogenase (quinone)